MRIAYVITRGDSIGGAQIHVADLARHVARGHEVCVLMGYGGALADQLTQAGIAVRLVRHLVRPLAPHADAPALFELVAALRAFQPDLIHAHSSKAGILARLAGRLLRVPVIFTAHGWSFCPAMPQPGRTLYHACERALAPFAARIICVSECDRRLALEAGVGTPEQLVTVHNGVADVPRALRADAARPPRIAVLARLATQKNHRLLFEAVRELPAAELELFGDGPLRGELEQLARALGIHARVHFRGHCARVAEALAECQLLAMTSNHEGFSLSILEAMRAALPVVVTDVGGNREAVEHGRTGLLSPLGDVRALRDNLARLLDDAALRVRMGQAGRARYEARFTLERCFGSTLEVYRAAAAAPLAVPRRVATGA